MYVYKNYLSFSAVQNLIVHLLVSTDSIWWNEKVMAHTLILLGRAKWGEFFGGPKSSREREPAMCQGG